MADIDQVKYDIERCISHVPDACRDCSHYWGKKETDADFTAIDCMEKLLAEAYDLLKEQDAVKPVNIRWVMGINGGNCPKCMNWVQKTYNYCPFCGKAVKWDG
jgi:predicted amidophosphoribosyltransferase